ncbi:MAG: hypothetical protein H0X33_13090 [Taibaiella sp.]|nr:hypothetical protein [Taibaiella sp.]
MKAKVVELQAYSKALDEVAAGYYRETVEYRRTIKELESKLRADLESCNKEWREINDKCERRIAELKKANSDLAAALIKPEIKGKEYKFHLLVGGDFVCGFCGSTNPTVTGIQSHIRDNH